MLKIKPHSAVVAICLLYLSNTVNAQKKNTDTATAAVSIVEKKNIEELIPVSIDALLQGQAAGMQVTNVSGAPGSGALTTIRGVSTLHAGTLPLYIVDGIPVKTYRFGNPLGKNAD